MDTAEEQQLEVVSLKALPMCVLEALCHHYTQEASHDFTPTTATERGTQCYLVFTGDF